MGQISGLILKLSPDDVVCIGPFVKIEIRNIKDLTAEKLGSHVELCIQAPMSEKIWRGQTPPCLRAISRTD